MKYKRKVLILISTFNGEKYLQTQLNSIFEQSYRNIEIFVRDDGSTDSTVKILEKNRLNNKLNYYVGENIGGTASFLELSRNANKDADYYAYCDQDDYWEREKIERAVDMIEKKNLDIPLVYCSQVKIVDQDLVWNSKKYGKKVHKISFENALIENIVTGCTVLMNRKAMEKVCQISDARGIYMHDWLLYMIGTSMGEIIYDEKSYILYRQHSSNSIGIGKNLFEEILRKVKRISMYNKNQIIMNNLKAFYKNYKQELSKKCIEQIKNYFKAENCIWKRIKLIFSKNFYRQNKIDSLILKIVFVIRKI